MPCRIIGIEGLHMQKFRRRCLLIAVPIFFGFLLFYIFPFILTIRYSFVNSAFDQSFVWFKNYIAVYGNDFFQLAVKNTVIFMIIGVPALVGCALALGVLMDALGDQHRWIRTAFVLPIVLPSVSIAKVFLQMLAGLSPRFSIVFVFVWKNIGFHLVLILAAIRMTDKSVYEAAELDGAVGIKKLIHITIPQIRGTLFFCVILATSQSLKIYREAYLMWGSYPPNEVYFLQHFMNNHFAKLNYQTLSAAALSFAVVLFGLVAIAIKQERRMEQ